MPFVEILIILFLIIVNGFFVGAEFAIVSLRPSRIEELIKEGRPLATLTKRVATQLNDMLSVCQVGITIASLLLGWLGEKYVGKIIESTFIMMNLPLGEDFNIHGVSIMLAFGVITFLHITMGELIPKSIAIVSYESVAIYSAIPMMFFYYFFYPVTFLLNRVTNLVLTALKIQDSSHKFVHTAEELMIILEEQNRRGTIDEQELKIIQNTFEFSEHDAKEVMTHRLNMVGLAEDAKIKDILSVIAENRFSRYPVYDKSMDNIIGVLHVQSLIEWLSNSTRNKNETVRSIMQKPVIVYETLSIEKVMQKLRLAKQHMAIVIDEYGGVSGLLTMEDIIEEVFGQISDETDDEHPITHDINTDSYIIDGERELDELVDDVLLGENIEHNQGVRTIAGFFLQKHEDVPKEGSIITIKKGTLTVTKMEGNKILNIRYDHTPVQILPIKEDYD
jgi:CBS domain containing-hemolysin-like protein